MGLRVKSKTELRDGMGKLIGNGMGEVKKRWWLDVISYLGYAGVCGSAGKGIADMRWPIQHHRQYFRLTSFTFSSSQKPPQTPHSRSNPPLP
jgi:hypothetical protein